MKDSLGCEIRVPACVRKSIRKWVNDTNYISIITTSYNTSLETRQQIMGRSLETRLTSLDQSPLPIDK
jgi:hypothetical protein